MAYHTMNNFAGPGKLVMFGTLVQPNLQQILDAVKKEMPGRSFSEIYVNDHVWLSEARPMYPDRVE